MDNEKAGRILPSDVRTRKDIVGVLEAKYTMGGCYAFAVAMQQRTGWPIHGVPDAYPDDVGNTVPLHVGVRDPDGRFHDVTGIVPEERITSRWGRPASVVFTVDQLRPFASPFLDQMAAAAHVDIDYLLGSERAGADAFLADLEALCVRHGYWIRGQYPAAQPILEKAVSDEAGYRAMSLSPGKWTIERVLASED